MIKASIQIEHFSTRLMCKEELYAPVSNVIFLSSCFSASVAFSLMNALIPLAILIYVFRRFQVRISKFFQHEFLLREYFPLKKVQIVPCLLDET